MAAAWMIRFSNSSVSIGDADVGDAGDHFGDTLDAGLKRLPGTEDGAVFLHGALHGGAEFRRGG